MRYWDSSAIVPLLIGEVEHTAVRTELEQDAAVATWWGTGIECVSALARREREGSLAPEFLARALRRLDGMASAWQEVEPVERVRQTANRLLRVHPLRGADALQLAAAIVAAENSPTTLPLVTLDDRLAYAVIGPDS
jgi:predicted nucleic acid-binding protein